MRAIFTSLVGRASLFIAFILFFVSNIKAITYTSISTLPPVELASFEAVLNADKVNIDWYTATERNNDYFTVERSNDGINFVPLFLVDGEGNSSAPKIYSAIDESPLNGISYYRLKLTDFNGEHEYSKIKAINYISVHEFNANVFPDPVVGNDINISVVGKEGDEAAIMITDLKGKQMLAEVVIINNGIFTFSIDENILPGIYLVNVRSKESIINKKIIIQ